MGLSAIAYGQTVTIKKVELAGEKVIVHYDLEDSNPNNEYLLGLYTSKDNFTKAVTNVTGDIGMDIKPGGAKKIEWNIVKEFGGYKGKLQLEVRGKVYVPFVRLKNFDPTLSYRRGKTYPLEWKPGNNNPINIELFNGGQRVTGEVNHPNNGSYELFIPMHAKPGKEYKIKITDTRNSDEVIFTQSFTVKPKIPMLLKAAVPVAVIGAAVVFLSGGSKSPETGTTPVEEDILDPNFPTGN